MPIPYPAETPAANPMACVFNHPLEPRRADFDQVRDLAIETGVLEKKVSFDDYANPRFSDGAMSQNAWRCESGEGRAQ
jgi:NitT/TauT family transport system substrate-binding protein